MIIGLAMASGVISMAQAATLSSSDFSYKDVVSVDRSPPPPAHPAAPTPAPPPPPPPPTPQVAQHQIIPLPPRAPFTPPTVVSTDVTKTTNLTGLLPPNAPPVSDGIFVLADNQFPRELDNTRDKEGILVRARENTTMERTGDCAVKLTEGTILVSVRRPTRLGFIKTPAGEIALSADGEVLVSMNKDTLHVLNASARGAGCKIRLAPHLAQRKHTFAIQAGYDFVAGEHRLTRADLRPADGIARRRSQVFEEGHIAVSEFSVHGVLSNCDLVASLQQKDSGTKERRILADMSKMAAVLNQVNGSMGYSYSGTGLAGKDQKPAM